MLRRWGAWACVVAVAAVVPNSACAQRTRAAKTESISQNVPIAMTLKLRGALRVDLDRTIESLYTRVQTDAKDAGAVRVLAVRPSAAVTSGPAAFVPSMAVIPYKGDGRYYVDKDVPGTAGGTKSPTAGGMASSIKSSLSFLWWPTGQLDSDPLQFSRPLTDCKIDISKSGTVGHAVCPKLATKSGDRTVSLDLRWKAPKVLPTTTTTASSVP